jgi:hypothetical protein
MDNLVFEESVNTEVEQSEFIEKKWVYVNDNNSQNYSSQVVIDSTPLANAGGYVNWSEGYILMPLVAHLTGTATNVGVAEYNRASVSSSFAMKAGYWHMLNSMSVEFNNQTIIQQTPFLNVFRSFKAHSSMSQDDLVNHGDDIGYAFDSADSWDFDAVFGVRNNASVPPTEGLASGFWDTDKHNKGLQRRAEFVSVCNTGGARSKASVVTDGVRSSQYQTHLNSFSTVAGTAEVRASVDAVWHIYAKLRLKDIAEYFEKCPMLKGSTMRFLINTNQTQVGFTLSNVGVASAVTASVLGGNTCPLQLATREVANDTRVGGKVLTSVAGSYVLTLDIVKSRQSGNYQTALTSCRLYAPVYRFNPMAEQRYLSLSPTKKIEYNDIFQYQFNNIGANDPFNFLVSNGIANIQSVLVVPFISASPTDNNGTGNLKSILSPFSSAGATPDPIPLSNFNILLSGVNLFLNNQDYDFEAFTHQLLSANQLNGNLTTGLTSGLIGRKEFQELYRYYYGNCSRSLPSEEGISKSVQIVGKNVSAKAIDLMVFVEFKRSMTIDITTGARIE